MYTSFHVSPKAKRHTWVYQSEMLSCIAKTAIQVKGSKLQVKFPVEKNTVTVDTDDEQFNCRWTFRKKVFSDVREVRRLLKTQSPSKFVCLFFIRSISYCEVKKQLLFRIETLFQSSLNRVDIVKPFVVAVVITIKQEQYARLQARFLRVLGQRTCVNEFFTNQFEAS